MKLPDYNNRISSPRITRLQPGEIFVFGSNLSGAHGGGAARLAMQQFGAVWGQGAGLQGVGTGTQEQSTGRQEQSTGRQGQSYAIPTMHGGPEAIKPYVDDFIQFARQHPDLTFLVTEIGCGIAGFTPDEMAPLFAGAIDVKNIHLPERFWLVLDAAGR